MMTLGYKKGLRRRCGAEGKKTCPAPSSFLVKVKERPKKRVSSGGQIILGWYLEK